MDPCKLEGISGRKFEGILGKLYFLKHMEAYLLL
jgi:hypothetical protein